MIPLTVPFEEVDTGRVENSPEVFHHLVGLGHHIGANHVTRGGVKRDLPRHIYRVPRPNRLRVGADRGGCRSGVNDGFLH